MYGENSARLRDALATLLGQYHVRQRLVRELSGASSPQSIETHQSQVGNQVRRYRRTILSWCHQALVEADPNPKDKSWTGGFDPPDRLRQSVKRILDRDRAPLPSMDDLTTPQEGSILELWRQAAKAATQAERDFDRGLGDGLLGHREWLTLVGDVADITNALRILDKRYQGLPGWEKLGGIRHLDRYLEDCSNQAQGLYGTPDYNIDWRGWHSPDPEVPPDAAPITYVIAAEHRVLNALMAVPSMTNLRHLLASQRELSNLAANRAREIAPAQAAKFRARERAYATLGRASRSAAGLAGTGAAATRHSAEAAARLVAIPVGSPIAAEAFRALEKLFRHVDNRLCSAIEHGFNTRLYLVRRTLPRIDPTDGRLAHQSRAMYDTLEREGGTPLIAIARHHLRNAPPPMAAPGAAARTRGVLRAALHRTTRRADGMTI